MVGSALTQMSQGEGLEGGIREENVRYRKIAGRGRRNILFLVDTSGSMLSSDRLAMVKGCVVSLLEDAYRARTRVAVVGFGGAKARLVLPFTQSPELAAQRIGSMKGGGTTPLVQALAIAAPLLESVEGQPVSVIVLSDGRYDRRPGVASERLIRDFGAFCHRHGVQLLLVDSGHGGKTARTRATRLARLLHAEYRQLESMRAEDLVQVAEGFSPQ